MDTFSETFICTALAESVVGTKLRIAVLVSPRLASSNPASAPLDNWPDARDWPAIQPTWQVKVTQGATTATLPATEVVAQPYDLASWKLLFPATKPTVPYQPTDRSAAPVRSYPAAMVRDATRALHMNALTTSRAEHPQVADLRRNTTFAAIKQAADPAFMRRVQELQADDPVPDASVGVGEAFAMVELFHGSRPGSAPPPPPTVTLLTPSFGGVHGTYTITVTGTNLKGAKAVKFGTVSATGVTVAASGTQLTCTVPDVGENAGVLPVTVTTSGGTSAITPASQFSFVNHVH